MNDPVSFLSSVLALLGLWLAFDVEYRGYCVDLLRDRLRELRSELFEAARAGHFGDDGFSDPAYCDVHRALDVSIRFADQMSLSRLLILRWSSRWWLDPERVRQRSSAFHRALMSHDEEARGIISRIMREADVAIGITALHTNALGFVLICIAKLAACCFRAPRDVRAFIAQEIVRCRSLRDALEQGMLWDRERPGCTRSA